MKNLILRTSVDQNHHVLPLQHRLDHMERPRTVAQIHLELDAVRSYEQPALQAISARLRREIFGRSSNTIRTIKNASVSSASKYLNNRKTDNN